MSIVYDYLGDPMTLQTIAPGNTATGLNAATIETKGDAKVHYNSGGTYVMKVGDVVTGATSAATARVTARVLESGTDGAGSAVGWLYLENVSGTFEAENLNVGANANVATIATDVIRISRALQAKAMFVTCEGATVHFSVDGSTPTAAAGTNLGQSLTAGSSLTFETIRAIRNFKVIDRVSGSAGTVKVVCFF